jgi:O-antigen/teichoic acid export membrane protein
VNDALWFGVQSLVITGLLLTGHPGATGLTVAFGAGATAASALGAWQCRATPSPRSWLMWLRAQRDLGIPFVTELLVVNAAPQISMLGVAALGGVVAVGELRAAIFLCSPPTVLFSGLVLVAVPEAVRLRSRSLPGLRALVLGLAVLMTVTTGLWAAALRLVPSTVGSALLGPNWGRGRHLLVPVAIFVALTACMLAALVGLRALEATRASLRVRSWAGPVTLTVTVIGAYTGGSEGAAVGLGASALFSAILTWAAFQRAVVSEATYISHGRKPRLLDPDAASP